MPCRSLYFTCPQKWPIKQTSSLELCDLKDMTILKPLPELCQFLFQKTCTTSAHFGSTCTKTGTIQRKLAWPLHRDDGQIRENLYNQSVLFGFHICEFITLVCPYPRFCFLWFQQSTTFSSSKTWNGKFQKYAMHKFQIARSVRSRVRKPCAFSVSPPWHKSPQRPAHPCCVHAACPLVT